jgi:hypothetical protein
MDSQEQFFKDQIKIILEKRDKESPDEEEHENVHESNESPWNTEDDKYGYITGTFVARYKSQFFVSVGFSSLHHFLLQSAGNCHVQSQVQIHVQSE